MKTHLNFRTSDLAKSISFYQTLLQAAPAKRYDDYALFITDDPGLELALDSGASAKINESAHYGLVVESVEAVDAAIARLQQAHLETDVEREATCCYANQTKVWTVDPDGRRWEVYAVHAETAERESEACCSEACCA